MTPLHLSLGRKSWQPSLQEEGINPMGSGCLGLDSRLLEKGNLALLVSLGVGAKGTTKGSMKDMCVDRPWW